MKMEKRWLVLVVLLFLPFVSASVFINEIELNPKGTDSGIEWIEIFNDNGEVNLTGWYIQDRDKNNLSFPSVIIHDFYVLDSLNNLVNVNENISLFNDEGILQNQALLLTDEENDNRTWQRIPDGTGDFIFKQETKNNVNQETIIENKTSYPDCILSGENVSLSVQVSGLCINEIIFSIYQNGNWGNYTGVSSNGIGNYSYLLDSSLLNASQEINWTVFARDCFNNTNQNGIESFYVNSRTSLSVSPAVPDGLDEWYISQPAFNLINSDAVEVFYRWNGNGPFLFSGSFGLEDAPNNGNFTGGIHALTYWSNLSCRIEPEQTQVFYFDFTNPVIKDLFPEENETIYNSRPEISAYLDELYQSNSGIKLDSVIMQIDSMVVSPTINESGDLDAIVNYISLTNLSQGKHNISIYVEDNSNRSSSKFWEFNVSDFSIFSFQVNLPLEGIYNERRIWFDLNASKELEKLEYFDWSGQSLRWRTLCRNCGSYEKRKTFSDGQHNLTIRASDEFEQVVEKNISFFIDSKKPRISRTEPQRGFANGSFIVKFKEENPENLFLNYGNEIIGFRNQELNLSNCWQDNRYKKCQIFVNLSDYNHQEIEYWFNMSDIAGNFDDSRKRDLDVDLTSPIINFFNYTIDSRKVNFEFNITELNLDEINYIDWNARRPRERRLCSRLRDGICEKTKRFSVGEHSLTINILDDAGNSVVIKNVLFEIE